MPPCTYHESIQLKRSITLLAAGATVDGENSRSTGVTVTGNNVTIDGLTVTRVRGDSHTGAVNVQGAAGFTFRNGVARDSATVCLALHGASGAKIVDSELTGCGKEGYFLNGVTDSVLARNFIHHNNPDLASDWFVEAGGGKTMASSRVTFDANEVAWNRGPGIWFDNGAKNVVVTGNKVHDNDREGIFFEISSGARISGNAVWGNGFGFATWGWGAGISISSSDGAAVSGNTVAWNARGISVISQARQLSPHDHDTVTDNIVVSAHGGRVAGWYDDHGGSLFNAANANAGSGNQYWVGDAEPTDYRFEWNGGRRTLASYNDTRGEEGGSYLSTSDRDAALGAAGIPGRERIHAAEARAAIRRPADHRGRHAAGRDRRPGADPVDADRDRDRVPAAAPARRRELDLRRPALAHASHAVTVTLATGHAYRARLRLRTPPSTWSSWATSASVTPRRFQEGASSIDYGPGTWRHASGSHASGGAVRFAKSKGATATFRFTGRAVAWVSTLGPSRGAARVYVDGTYRTTVGLHASSLHARRLVFRASWGTRGSHTIVIRVVGTAGHPRVDVDAFAVIG